MKTKQVSMGETSMGKVGSICSIIAGVIYVISGAAFYFLAGKFDYNSIKSISDYFNSAPGASAILTIVNGGAALASFLAIAGVLALSDRVRPAHEGLIRWTGVLAIIGYAILAVSDISDLYQIKRMAFSYARLEGPAQHALEAMGIGSLDPTLTLRYITIGPWFLVVGLIALRNGQLPKLLAVLGIIAGIAALLFVVVSFLDIQALTMVTITITLLFHPFWLIWTGLELGRIKSRPEL